MIVSVLCKELEFEPKLARILVNPRAGFGFIYVGGICTTTVFGFCL